MTVFVLYVYININIFIKKSIQVKPIIVYILNFLLKTERHAAEMRYACPISVPSKRGVDVAIIRSLSPSSPSRSRRGGPRGSPGSSTTTTSWSRWTARERPLSRRRRILLLWSGSPSCGWGSRPRWAWGWRRCLPRAS